MQVEALTVVLRPRPMAEAADLGVALVRQHARSVWLTFLPVYGALVVLALCTFEIASWLPALMIFWLKPWLDRSVLFVLSRAVFGQSTRWADVWQNRRQVWAGQLWRTLFLQRFSRWRAYVQAVDQLEGLRGQARRKRCAQLLEGRGGAAFVMQFVFAHIELAVYVSLLSILLWFAPEGSSLLGILKWLNTDSLTPAMLVFGAYVTVVALLEPFFVGAGFAMYLNRRVELEAWDIEQEFRHAFAR